MATTKNHNNIENHPDYFHQRIGKISEELDIRKIIGFGPKFANKKIEKEKKFLFSFPCISYQTKYDKKNIYTFILPLGSSCLSKKKEDIAKDLNDFLGDFLQSYSFDEIAIFLETSEEHFSLYRQLYTLLKQMTASQELFNIINTEQRIDELEKSNKELQNNVSILEKSNQELQRQKDTYELYPIVVPGDKDKRNKNIKRSNFFYSIDTNKKLFVAPKAKS